MKWQYQPYSNGNYDVTIKAYCYENQLHYIYCCTCTWWCVWNIISATCNRLYWFK